MRSTSCPGRATLMTKRRCRPPSRSTAAADAPVKGTRGGVPASGSIADLTFPKVERATLTNGMTLVYAQRTATPVTRIAVSFDAGVSCRRADRARARSS